MTGSGPRARKPANRNGVGASRQPSLSDVAALAGVSHMTVSRVINDTGPVGPATRAKVRAAIDELGYHPNSAARALVTGRTGTLGVVTMDSTLYGPASMLYGVESAARKAGFSVSIASVQRTTGRFIADAVEALRQQGVEGIVVIAAHAEAARALEAASQDIPLVAVGVTAPSVPSVSVDNYTGARMVTEHLLDRGHARVWHVRGPLDWLEAGDRERGWRDALTERGIDPPRVVLGDWSPRSGYAAGQQLAGERDLGAVFVANDQMALGVLRAFAESGIAVPGDVHLAGFDDVPEAEYFGPPLTTVRQDFHAVGRKTFALLAARMSGEQPDLRHSITPVLVVRQSTRT